VTGRRTRAAQQPRPKWCRRRFDGADDALESHQSAKRLGPDSHGVTKDALELSCAEPGQGDQGIDIQRSIRVDGRPDRRQHTSVGTAARP